MSDSEIKQEIQSLYENGEISHDAAKEALKNPMQGATLVRMNRIEKSQARQDLALFGDKHEMPPGVQTGLVADVQFLKVAVWRGIWTVAGGTAVGGALIAGAITFLTLFIEWHKK